MGLTRITTAELQQTCESCIKPRDGKVDPTQVTATKLYRESCVKPRDGKVDHGCKAQVDAAAGFGVNKFGTS